MLIRFLNINPLMMFLFIVVPFVVFYQNGISHFLAMAPYLTWIFCLATFFKEVEIIYFKINLAIYIILIFYVFLLDAVFYFNILSGFDISVFHKASSFLLLSFLLLTSFVIESGTGKPGVSVFRYFAIFILLAFFPIGVFFIKRMALTN